MEARKFSTHILDTSVGKAAANVRITVSRLDEIQEWRSLRAAQTDADGRCLLLESGQFPSGIYKLTFHVGAYYAERSVRTLYPAIDLIVDCSENQNYHIPLLLNPFGYSTYRGT
ncbi:5-hydroxyisourate hydrolase [Drosophila sechellia]|uniref:5-hydroxyisourate hydrolase n=1 Tax=Drosophila sechellia TaxID=7238 RepID=B4HN15_DROSE|nr:5-hydroxyisourate hydrolase [Drosophila sechellia]EDW47319.1 GM20486 [Drosophila sechellia]